ncbi:MAG: carboxypeptidase regulatory-like domain-containing protein [Chitinophagaceae bacterium]|nr:MAG: carboxypeptidase regulatory-like domain-containing protein [Chitinophagaceae bacterium]
MIKLFIFSVFILLSTFCYSQIEGDIEDSNSKGIADAVITATDTTGKLVATVRSDKRGFYFFNGLKIGKYKIEVKAPGFKDAVYENVKVRIEIRSEKEGNDISAATRLDIALKPLKSP